VSVSLDELQLAARNHGMPLEALRHDVTPLGLHYLLIHYDVPLVDVATWRLEVGGLVERPRSLTLEDLQALPSVTMPVTLECAGNGRAGLDPRPLSQPWLVEAVGTGRWTGVPLRALLDAVGVRGEAVEVVFGGLDRGVEGGVEQAYERSLPLDDPVLDEAFLAYALNGVPLPPQHGFPLRLVVPGWYGMASVKWLARIAAVDAPFTGYQQARGYRLRTSEDDPGEPVSRIEPRALMVPPGIPDFMTRQRFVAPGPVVLEGRAWSGWGPVERVEVSTDGGATWADASVQAPAGPRAWSRFELSWEAAPGEYELRCRATDATGRRQPGEAPWNVGGYANNAVHRLAVTVRHPA
jgi:DMSO/TMAO reductase YedYZ molybdopterin-dependent catalytic subunit